MASFLRSTRSHDRFIIEYWRNHFFFTYGASNARPAGLVLLVLDTTIAKAPTVAASTTIKYWNYVHPSVKEHNGRGAQ
jgi:hypothetical protein